MMKCQKCGLLQFDGMVGYAGPQCKCFTNWEPPRPPRQPQSGCQPLKQLTEADVRRIVREVQAAEKRTEAMRPTDEQIDAAIYAQCPDFDAAHEGPSIDDVRAIVRRVLPV